MRTIAVILFPGSNCELEALRTCKRVGMNTKLVRWNEKTFNPSEFDGFILPGGFAYEDRGRSGVIASKDPILQKILAEAQSTGKPLIGICNGAQMLVELGAIPGISISNETDKSPPLEMALAWNERVKNGKILGVGFYNDWVYITNDATPGRCAFNNFPKGTVLKMPVANGEGRYTTQIPELLDAMIAQEQTIFRYSTPRGEIINEFPVNPNNAMFNLAGICNIEGNIMALMPHPERSQLGDPIFDSMKRYIEDRKSFQLAKSIKNEPKKINTSWKESDITPYAETASYTFLIELIITDNEERTIEQAFHQLGFTNLSIKKQTYVNMTLSSPPTDHDAEKALLEAIIHSNEVMNPNKEMVTITTKDGKEFTYDIKKGLMEIQENSDENKKRNGMKKLLVLDTDNYAGKSMKQSLESRCRIEIDEVKKGVLWSFDKEHDKNELAATHLLHNPHSAALYYL